MVVVVAHHMARPSSPDRSTGTELACISVELRLGQRPLELVDCGGELIEPPEAVRPCTMSKKFLEPASRASEVAIALYSALIPYLHVIVERYLLQVFCSSLASCLTATAIATTASFPLEN